ncbi:Cell division and transport-associated protein TolA [Rhizobium sp. RU20A]|uniref:hypothetical protein n=1 Tax=Rhizobium sp. RU20A TaxID=1907412 RepID=UPI00095567FB|nr:hypothetical protein [Rhizobium sp. RU20A]SIQ37586.1 Cell division and transport-associated protein TolA [Rhizobium sp. RU20A]
MKASLITSSVVHAMVLTLALASFGSPEPFEVMDVESLPVDIVPVESITQIQQGDKTAPKAEKSSPVPTKRPDIVENAENVGENTVDLKNTPTPNVKPKETESAAAPEKTEKAPPTPDPVQEEIKASEEQAPAPEPVPQEVAALPESKPEVKPETKPEPVPAETKPAESPEAEALPDNVPTPQMKPKVEKAAEKPVEKPVEKKPETETAKADTKTAEQKKKEQKKAASAKESDFNADEIAALLNKQDPSGGGAKRATEQASLGGKKTTGGNTLSMSEMDALRGQIQNNWSIIPGMADASDVRIKVTIKLDESGAIIGEPEVEATGGTDAARRALSGGARRAVLKSSPFKGLPADKYDSWSEVVVNFDPSSML